MRARVVAGVVPAVLSAGLLIGGAVMAGAGPSGDDPRAGNSLQQNWAARNAGQQVLGGSREPGVPSIQRLRHDNVVFTVTVAPSLPGPNLVRLDSVHFGPHGARHRTKPAFVGTSEQDLVKAVPRPGTDGLWAVVDLPEGTGTVLVTHGRWHRVPFAVETGTTDQTAAEAARWTGPDGPECVSVATASLISGAGRTAAGDCPAEGLSDPDRTAVERLVDTLAGRGVEELALQSDSSARSREARTVAEETAAARGLRIVDPQAAPGERDALLVLGGWATSARSLAAVTSRPLQEQPIRSDGTWMAPWLLTPGVIDATAGAILPLTFDIRSTAAQEYSQTLATYLPGQAPTASGYLTWRAARGESVDPLALYAASRAAFMPSEPGHPSHETQVAWFPGGTVTPVGLPLS